MSFYAAGTPFQHKVWQTLLQIPSGQTLSYQALAEKTGNIKAVRAVASAVANNRLCPFIPCHRVIHTNGALGGFAYGSALKKALLEKEKP